MRFSLEHAQRVGRVASLRAAVDALKALNPTCNVAECLIEIRRLLAHEQRTPLHPLCIECSAQLIERQVWTDGVVVGTELRCPSC